MWCLLLLLAVFKLYLTCTENNLTLFNNSYFQPGAKNFDPQALPPDKISVELEIGPSVLLAYGSVLRNFIHLKVYKILII